MSSWSCYNGSNNIHFDFPAIMSSGNLYTSYQPEAVVNNRIREKEQIKTNWEYRQYLTNNALQVMKYNTMESCYEMGITSNTQVNNTPSKNVPLLYKSTFDENRPTYGYCNSDLKSPYMSREQLQARLISPSISQNN